MHRAAKAISTMTALILVGVAAITVDRSAASAAYLATAVLPADDVRYLHVRAEYVDDYYGNRDETVTTLFLVNKSLSKSVTLGDIQALGPDGQGEVMATHSGLNGVVVPPLGSVELVVDSTNFPGLVPVILADDRGVASALVRWNGPKDALRLVASIQIAQLSLTEGRAISVIEGHTVVK